MSVLRLPEGELRRCAQCYEEKPYPDAFIGKRGLPVRSCAACRARYGNWAGKSVEEKLAGIRRREDAAPRGRVFFTRVSQNAKTGPIPVSISECGTCPPSCGLYDAGCYADYSYLGMHWRRLSSGAAEGLAFEDFLLQVRALPRGQLWRHNEAGDLAGAGEELDMAKFVALVRASAGRRGFTYTHKVSRPEQLDAYRWARGRGFVVNLSADSPEHADALLGPRPPGREEFAHPVVCLLPADAPDRGNRTPAGRAIVVCPAQTSAGMTCDRCELCAKPDRHSVIGFRAHGRSRNLILEIVRSKRNPGSVRALALAPAPVPAPPRSRAPLERCGGTRYGRPCGRVAVARGLCAYCGARARHLRVMSESRERSAFTIPAPGVRIRRVHVTWEEFNAIVLGLKQGPWYENEAALTKVLGAAGAAAVVRACSGSEELPEIVPHGEADLPPERFES